ncbi:MAG: hypothetical protein PHY48_17740, partial [Candidatus Cloacimonetes bacterium]|nr:hypothetical protein [Candidatus Cloacimonadota bacterium]
APGGAGSFTEVFTRTSLNASAFAMGAGSNSFSFYKKDNAGEANLTATAGAVYYNTTNNKLKVYNGTTWESIGGESLWVSENISSWTEGQYLGEGTEGLAQSLSAFSLDPDEGRATINTNARRGGLSVYSAYTGTDAWSLVSIKGEKSTFNGTLLNLTQDGTGDLIQGHYQSSPTPNFRVDRFGGLHLSLDGIGYFEKFLSLPSSASLHPSSNEGCLYSVGSNLYWDPACDASGPVALGAGSTSLWTDSGTFSYLTSTTDDLVLGASTTSGSSFFFDVSAKRLGIGTDTPQAAIDIAGADSTISNTSGNITITPAGNLIVDQGNVGIGDASPASLLTVGSGDLFQVNSSGDMVKIKNVTYSWPSSNSSGVLTNSGSGSLTWAESASGGSLFTDSGDITWLTSTTDDFVVGASNTLAAAFSVDVSANTVRLGKGSTSNAILNMYSSGGDTGSITYTTNDSWAFEGGNVGIGVTDPTARLSVQGSITGGENAISTAENNFAFGYHTAVREPVFMNRDSNPGANSTVFAIALQSDGKVLIGGAFTKYGGTTRQGVARLNSDGSLDTTFDSSSGADSIISAIAVQSDGKVLIGGEFTSYGGTTRQRVARLNSDGTLDTSFGTTTGASSNVSAIAVQSDGKVLIGGAFTSYGGTARRRVARLNSDGSLDTSFGSSFSGLDNSVSAIAVQSDGKVLIGGSFTKYGVTTRQRVARLNSDGSLDTSFGSTTGANSTVFAIALQSDGKVLIGGAFTSYGGTTRWRVARLNSDGTLDTSFGTTMGNVSAIAVQSDGKILIGGSFTVSYGGIIWQRVARLNSDGSLDTSFGSSSGADGAVAAIALQSDGKVLIGGGFTSYGGITRQGVARLNSDGSLDTS